MLTFFAMIVNVSKWFAISDYPGWINLKIEIQLCFFFLLATIPLSDPTGTGLSAHLTRGISYPMVWDGTDEGVRKE